QRHRGRSYRSPSRRISSAASYCRWGTKLGKIALVRPRSSSSLLRLAMRGRASTRQRLERGSEQAVPLARVDGLEPLMLAFPASGRQAIFLGATGPRATRPEETRRGATLVSQGRLAVSTKW